MERPHQQSADRARRSIERGRHDPAAFREALLEVPARARDAWVDRVLDLGELPDDGTALPRGCVPYLPCPVDSLLRMVDRAPLHASDLFVDVGSGAGRAAALAHLLTGATAVGIEVQPSLVRVARQLASTLSLSRVAFIEGDATELTGHVTSGSVFFLYCPFSGPRLAKVVDDVESVARAHTVRICSVDLPLPARPWLTLESDCGGDLAIYRSTLVART
jgi:SAM-dependent methyltransferase